MQAATKQLTLIAPRGFCAGVDRAIKIVEQALKQYGKPVYVRHEIVHNQRVVETLEAQGAVFVDELNDVPNGVPVIFSAHGVPKAVPRQATERGLSYLDATCPLVSKVHIEASRHEEEGRHILLIGHHGHPEVIGTMGQVALGRMTLIETLDDALNFQAEDPNNLAYVTQTTLSVDDTADIIAILMRRFPSIKAPHKEDICYATTNRQDAVKRVAAELDLLLVIGSETSSNSKRLVEVALKAGCKAAQLIADHTAIDWDLVEASTAIGLTAGASAPEEIVSEVIAAVQTRHQLEVNEFVDRTESVHFNLPRELRS